MAGKLNNSEIDGMVKYNFRISLSLYCRVAQPPLNNDRVRISFCTDMDKSVLISNFEKRNWQSVSAEDDWNFYWASTTTCRNIFSVESGYRMQDCQ